MSEPGNAAPATRPPAPGANAGDPAVPRRMTELKVSANLMTLEPGLFCVFHTPGSAVAASATGLPGVRISPAPAATAQQVVEISTFSRDGWLAGNDDAALIRVLRGPAQVLVTIYQSGSGQEPAPKLQVIRLSGGAGAPAEPIPAVAPPAPPPALAASAPAPPAPAAISAHVQLVGDVAVPFGAWVGERGSKRWIEGFSVAPDAIGLDGVAAEDIEYQAVLGRGWVSPWVAGGAFCGSRGMALPILGFRLRLRGRVGAAFQASYAASFIDGTTMGPVAEGEACEAESLSPLEAFQITLAPRAAAGAKPAALPADKPTAPSRRSVLPARPAAAATPAAGAKTGGAKTAPTARGTKPTAPKPRGKR